MKLHLAMDSKGIRVRCNGLYDSIVDVAESLAWIGSALQESSIPRRIMYRSAKLGLNGNPNSKKGTFAKFLLTFFEEDIPWADKPNASNGGCWLRGLLGNPVIANGFPVPLRSDDTPGLEIPLEAMALLVNAPQLTISNNRAVLKGFNSGAVPTSYTDALIRWHFILNDDGRRLSYGDRRIAESPEISATEAISHIQGVRHILGWTPAAGYHIGKPISTLSTTRSMNSRRERVLIYTQDLRLPTTVLDGQVPTLSAQAAPLRSSSSQGGQVSSPGEPSSHLGAKTNLP